MLVAIPDSHGHHVNEAARDAVVRDVKALAPDRVVMLGDQLDCGGIFSAHQRSFTNEITESYEDDCGAANGFLNALQAAAPRAEFDQLEGNHEQHVERWTARNYASKRDADALLEVYGPAKKLQLKARGVRYFKRSEHYQGISIQGTIKRGNCFFTHGICANKHATHTHLEAFGANVVHGHTHTSQSAISRKVSSDAIGAWCPGTLSELQPLYLHTNPSRWTLGYHVQFHAVSGRFMAWNIPIIGGKSQLRETVDAIVRRRK